MLVMKTPLMVIAILLAMINPSYAEEITVADYCFQVLKTSEAIMSARQEGVEIHKLWDPDQSDFASRRLVDAYSQHMYLTDEYKSRIEKEFAAKYYVQCMEDYS